MPPKQVKTVQFLAENFGGKQIGRNTAERDSPTALGMARGSRRCRGSLGSVVGATELRVSVSGAQHAPNTRSRKKPVRPADECTTAELAGPSKKRDGHRGATELRASVSGAQDAPNTRSRKRPPRAVDECTTVELAGPSKKKRGGHRGATKSTTSVSGAQDTPNIRSRKKSPRAADECTTAELAVPSKKKRGGHRGVTKSTTSFSVAQDAPNIRSRKKAPRAADECTAAELASPSKKKRGGHRGATESTTSVSGGEDAPSIRSRKKPPHAADECAIVELAAPSKKKRGGHRGLSTTSRTEKLVHTTGEKVKITWDPVRKRPSCSNGLQRLTSDIGSIARSSVPMAPKWSDLDAKGRMMFWDPLMDLYEFDRKSEPLTKFLESTAKVRYNNWKNKIHDWWKGFKEELIKEGKDPYAEVPREFLTRPDQWRLIRNYWESADGIAKSEQGKAARGQNALKTRGGSKSMALYADEYEAGDTENSLHPQISAGLRCFPANDPHSPTRKRGGMFASAKEDFVVTLHAATLATQESGVEDSLPTPEEKKDLEVETIAKHIGESKGYYQSGFGNKVRVRKLRNLACSSSSNASAESSKKMDELTQLVQQQQLMLATLAEERKREQEERDEVRRQNEELMKQLDKVTKFLKNNVDAFNNQL